MLEDHAENKSEKTLGAQVVFEKFVERYNHDWEKMQAKEPNRCASEVAEWIPTLIAYYDESEQAKLSLKILEDLLRGAEGDNTKCKAIFDGLNTASIRTATKRSSARFYNEFLKSWREELFPGKEDDPEESITILGTYIPGVIWRYDRSFQADLALGIVRKALKETTENTEIEALRRGLLIRVLVEEDFPEVRKELEGRGYKFIDDE